MPSHTKTAGLLLITGLLMTACSDETDPSVPNTPSLRESSLRSQDVVPRPSSGRSPDFAKVSRGAELFAENCASCHGSRAEGGPLWDRSGPLPKNPAPPLNGTGHTWYHSSTVLKRIIVHGSAQLGSGMPPWGDKLSDDDIEAIIAWFQSLWPEDKYMTWTQIDAPAYADQATR